MNEKEVMIEFQNRIDVLEAKIDKIERNETKLEIYISKIGFCVFVILCVLIVLLSYYWVNK